MFTGIVRDLGTVESFDQGRLVVETSLQAAVGDSVAIDGACLTVVAGSETALVFDVVPETVVRSTLGSLEAGSRVNVEPALRASDPLGGHMVQGHVEAVGEVRSVEAEALGQRVWIGAPPRVLRCCVEKGSITVSGVSLTIAAVSGDAFAVALVPHTIAVTTLGRLKPGDRVNLETDVVARYVERLLPGQGLHFPP
jgi:riboflavin synthase